MHFEYQHDESLLLNYKFLASNLTSIPIIQNFKIMHYQHTLISFIFFIKINKNTIKNYRLPQAQERLRTARKHLSEVKLSEKQQVVNPKFTFQKEK